MNIQERIKAAVRDVPDFPKSGIVFKDITPILKDATLCKAITKEITNYWSTFDLDVIIGIESRGFLWGSGLAQALDLPFVLARKKGKLPADTYNFKYELEYGSAEIEIHKDALNKGAKALVHDDLLATGGTAKAVAELVEIAGGKVAGFSFLIALSFLAGDQVLKSYSNKLHSLVRY